jgi:membrane-associated phospholipid phosphatase
MSHRVKNFREQPWFAIPALVFLNTCLVYALFVPYGEEVMYFNPYRTEPFNSIFRFFTLFGEAWGFILAGLYMLFKSYRNTLLILIAGLLALAIPYILKDYIGTERPLTWFNMHGTTDQLVVVPDVPLASGFTSFPSGHTMSAFTLAFLLSMMTAGTRPWLGTVFALIAAMVGLSRIFLAQHFLADVLGGAVLGLLMGALIWRLGQLKWMQHVPDYGLSGRNNSLL